MNAEIPEISKCDFALRQSCFRLLLLLRFCVRLRCDHICTFWDVSRTAALSHAGGSRDTFHAAQELVVQLPPAASPMETAFV